MLLVDYYVTKHSTGPGTGSPCEKAWLREATLCDAMRRYAMLCYASLVSQTLSSGEGPASETNAMLRYVVRYAILCYAVLRYSRPCYAALCYAALNYVTLCCAMLCYAAL